jgi:dienelactone hydrolase
MLESTALRQALLARLGPFPKKVAPEMIVESRTELPDHTRTLVSYLVEPGERITAWLLTPNERPPAEGWPAILAIHQHGGKYDLGKAEPAGLSGNTAYGLELCRRGYIVLCPDQLCFEDRRPSEEKRAQNKFLDGMDYERYEFTSRLLRGSCLQTKYLHDLVCALDLLAALPEADSSRLGAIGHSLGGQETLWLSWLDERVKAAVSSCGFDLMTVLIAEAINHNFAAYVPGMLEICDTDTLLASIAPRAFLLTAGEQDPIFPIAGVRTLSATVQQAYTQAGVPDRFRSIIFPGTHSFPDDVKTEAYAFLDQWLR